MGSPDAVRILALEEYMAALEKRVLNIMQLQEFENQPQPQGTLHKMQKQLQQLEVEICMLLSHVVQQFAVEIRMLLSHVAARL
jgi:uncharacterized membrane protein YgcG